MEKIQIQGVGVQKTGRMNADLRLWRPVNGVSECSLNVLLSECRCEALGVSEGGNECRLKLLGSSQ